MNINKTSKRPLLKRTSTRILLAVAVLLVGAVWLLQPEPPPPARGSGESMKAILYHDYGTAEVLRLEDTEKMLPNENQVLIKVRAAAANPLDWHYMRGTPYFMRMESGFRKPSDPRIGTDVAGVVVEVGTNVTQFKPGDEVFGVAGGAFAEYARASQKRIALKPASLTFEQAASVPIAAITALQALRDKGKIQAGQKVLINGASGGVGTFAVQIAKSFGVDVTGVCSTRNIELVRSLGADHVIDYTKEDFTQGEQRYDLIMDNVGNRELSEIRRVLNPKGSYVIVGGGGPDAGNWLGPMMLPLKAAMLSPFVDENMSMIMAEVTTSDLTALAELMQAGKVTPVIDRTYPLAEVPEAIRYLEGGRARGKVVISVAPAS